MLKKSYFIFALALAAMLILPACSRSASPSLLATPTSNAATRAFGGSTDLTPTGMPVVSQYGTQTALAAQGVTPGAALPSITPNPLFTATPNAFGVSPTSGATIPTITNSIIVPTSTPGRPGTYTLQQGEYPYCLARRFNVDPQELLDLNGLTGTQLLQPGKILNIPQTGSPFPGSRALHPHPASYTVAGNDTIYAIACYFGDLDPSSIAIANNLTPPYLLTAGRVLSIP